jgi:ankyrin repeat protein
LHQQEQIEQLQQQQAEDDDDDEDEYADEYDDEDDDDDEGEDDDPLVMSNSLRTACQEGHAETIIRLLDAGKSVNCVIGSGETPIMRALWYRHLHVAIMLAGRGADLLRVSDYGSNVLHFAAAGGDCECIEWVLANTSFEINSTNNTGITSIRWALINNNLDAAKLLVVKGANLFKKGDDGRSAMDCCWGLEVLQHARDLIWE